MKKFAVVLAVILALVGVAQAATVTNALGQVWTTYGDEGAYAISSRVLVTNEVFVRSGIQVFISTNVYVDLSSSTWTNATIGDQVVSTYSNLIWTLTRRGVWTLITN